MVVAHRRRSVVAETLAHNLHGFSQHTEAAPRGAAEVGFVVRLDAYPPDGAVRAIASASS